mmetsp:Transcript_30418/g.74887  ORF Transcript_30418/g.74887 Transcript_30418/m.74887 type:complete len:129 (-) Transcript_30418:25-411(-)
MRLANTTTHSGRSSQPSAVAETMRICNQYDLLCACHERRVRLSSAPLPSATEQALQRNRHTFRCLDAAIPVHVACRTPSRHSIYHGGGEGAIELRSDGHGGAEGGGEGGGFDWASSCWAAASLIFACT